MQTTFLLGGARSGKSTLAVNMAQHHGGPVTFVATAEPFDDDLRERIARHQDERPASWRTVEAPVALASAILDAPADHFVIVDCLTVWLGNLLHHVPAAGERHENFNALIASLCNRRDQSAGPTVIVSNEVGMGIIPDTTLTREYRDGLGQLNQRVGAVADRTLLLVAGRALRLENPWELLT